MVLHGINRLGTIFAGCLCLVACDSVPHATPTAARPTGGTANAHRFVIDVDLTNAGEDDLPIDVYEYDFTVEGVGTFHGQWAAMCVIPSNSTISVELPAVLQAHSDYHERSWTITGDVRYQAPGILGQILFDIGVQRPSVGFAGSGTLLPAQSE
jgi:hypothetical protein